MCWGREEIVPIHEIDESWPFEDRVLEVLTGPLRMSEGFSSEGYKLL
jgi:hypothetical protein